MPTGSAESLLDRPFHVYDKAFLDIIGLNPTFQLIAEDPTLLFHEAAVWSVSSSAESECPYTDDCLTPTWQDSRDR